MPVVQRPGFRRCRCCEQGSSAPSLWQAARRHVALKGSGPEAREGHPVLYPSPLYHLYCHGSELPYLARRPFLGCRFLVLFYKCLSCLTRRGQVAIVVCSVISNSLWPYGLQHASFPVLYCLPEHAQTHFHWFSDAIQPSHPLSTPVSSCLQSFPASSSFWMSWLFTSGGQSIGVCVLCECDSFSISPSNEYPGLISFRMDWLDLLAVQGTLKSLLLKI